MLISISENSAQLKIFGRRAGASLHLICINLHRRRDNGVGGHVTRRPPVSSILSTSVRIVQLFIQRFFSLSSTYMQMCWRMQTKGWLSQVNEFISTLIRDKPSNWSWRESRAQLPASRSRRREIEQKWRNPQWGRPTYSGRSNPSKPSGNN